MEGPGRADLHTHTSVTDGMMDVGALLQYAEACTEVDVLAVTDHDDAAPGLMARAIARKRGYRFEVIAGEEITTREGHLIALFLEKTVARMQSLETTLRAIHDQGGLAVIPHPLSWLTFSLGRRAIRRVASSRTAGVYFDGIETANPSLAGRVTRAYAMALNEELCLPQVGASDAHFLACVATGYTCFPGRTATDLREALRTGETQARSTNVALREIGYGALAQQQVRSLVVHPARSVARAVRERVAHAAGRSP